jgi:hypothetical protein
MASTVSIDELVGLVTDCGVLVVDSPGLLDELEKRGFMVVEEGKGGKVVLHKTECEPPETDLKRLQSLVVDAYAPYSPKASIRPHPFAEDLQRHGRLQHPKHYHHVVSIEVDLWKCKKLETTLLSVLGFLRLVCQCVARVSAPQQIIMQSPSEPEFLRVSEDLVTHENVEQEVYADVRFRAAYTR